MNKYRKRLLINNYLKMSVVCKHHRFHLIFRQSDANMEIGDNLTMQFAHAPRSPNTFCLIEKAYQRVFYGKEFYNVGKSKFGNQSFCRGVNSDGRTSSICFLKLGTDMTDSDC